ncbi:hypothetical protein AB0C22_24695 [Micromonospora sp. NPDC048894]|uniref:hypothetical protein n=1 Tax=Micromonospora sp. NPDC048894 TaxID=3155493 RepID=UPI0033D24A97
MPTRGRGAADDVGDSGVAEPELGGGFPPGTARTAASADRPSPSRTAWQLRPGEATGTLRHLAGLADELRDLERHLTACLACFAGYHDRVTRALTRAGDDPAWITGVQVDSCTTSGSSSTRT